MPPSLHSALFPPPPALLPASPSPLLNILPVLFSLLYSPSCHPSLPPSLHLFLLHPSLTPIPHTLPHSLPSWPAPAVPPYLSHSCLFPPLLLQLWSIKVCWFQILGKYWSRQRGGRARSPGPIQERPLNISKRPRHRASVAPSLFLFLFLSFSLICIIGCLIKHVSPKDSYIQNRTKLRITGLQLNNWIPLSLIHLAIQTDPTLTLLTDLAIQMHGSSLCYPLHGSRTTSFSMWNAKIQWDQSVCQSASWIQLRSLGFGPTTPLYVRQSMPDNGFCQTIPAHLSTLPPRTGCKEHPINYRDHTDIIELFSPLPALITSHLLLKTDSPCTVAPSGSTAALQRFYDFCLWLWHTFGQSGARGLSDFKFGSHIATPYPLPPFLNARGKEGAARVNAKVHIDTGDLVVGFSPNPLYISTFWNCWHFSKNFLPAGDTHTV